MDKQLPIIGNDPIINEYMAILFNNGKKKEYDDLTELLQYISNMEKQLENLTNELHDFKETLNSMQNPSTKMKLKNIVDKVHLSLNDGKDRVNNLKFKLISSMKDCIVSFKQKGKEGVIKIIDVLHFKEALKGIQRSLFVAMKKTNEVIHRCDAMTYELRNAKRNFKNVGLLMLGKTVQKDTGDKGKLNKIQKGSRTILSTLKSMLSKTTNVLLKLEDFEKTSVKSEIRLLTQQSKNQQSNVYEKKEQSR